MSTILDQALKELRDLPEDAQLSIARDLLEMIRSEAKWDQLFADPRSKKAMAALIEEADADADGDLEFVPATQPRKPAK